MISFKAGKAAAGLAMAAVAAATLTTVPAHATASTTVTISPAGLNLSETRSKGHVDTRKDGLLVWTEDTSSLSKAAGYFQRSSEIPASASFDWTGTGSVPGMQIVFDVDSTTGNGNDWNLLVGEPGAYGDNWWLTNSSSAAAKAADPSGSNNSGGGSDYFGTLAQWRANLPSGSHMYAGGFSLGSGAKGSGKLTSITFDDTEYRFSNGAGVVQPSGVRVDPDHLGQWTQQAFSYESGNPLSVRQSFARGTHAAGEGALKFVVNDDTNPARVERFRTAAYDGLPLRDLQALTFSTLQVADAGNEVLQQPAYLRLSVTWTGADPDQRLYFYPANNGDQAAVLNGEWQQWNAGDGNWNLMGDGGPAAAFTLEQFLIEHPDARIVANPSDNLGGFAFQVGGGGAGQTNGSYYVDDVTIATRDGSAISGKRFDLEPEAAAPVVVTPPPTTMDVSGKYQVTRRNTSKWMRVRIVMTAGAQPEGSVEGKRLVWTIKADGARVFETSQHFGDRSAFVKAFKKKSGKHTVQIMKNGKVVRTVVVRTGR